MRLVVESSNLRIDKFLSLNTSYSRSKIQRLIKDGKILVNDREVSSSYLVKVNDVVDVYEDDVEVGSLERENMDLDIVYEDEYLAIINKRSGVVVHPAVGNHNHTLVNGLLYHFNIDSGDSIRPGIVHRLDKDTSGLMVVAKNDEVLDKLSSMIKNKEVERKYLALVWGRVMHDKGTIDAPIGRDINNRQRYCVTSVNSKESVTHFKVFERYDDATLLECVLDTGRTHQIRVHMNYINHPIVNDPVYGNRKIFNDYGQMLHSRSIRFIHPVTLKELYFECLPDERFYEILDNFR